MKNSNDFSGLDNTHLSDGLDDRLQILAALGDVLGSLKFDELSDDTLPRLGQLIYRTASEADGLTEELWRRFREAKVRLGDYPTLDESPPPENECADRVTGSAGAMGAIKDADIADGESTHEV